MIYLVRHGETNDNKNHIIQGNKSINSTGRKQVKNTALKLKDISFDICFCSPLKRAKQSLKIIKKYHKNLKVIFDDRLKERSYGELVGICFDTINKYTPTRWNSNFSLHDSVETPEQVYERVANFYEEILPKYEGKNILIVAHGGIARMTHFYFNGKPQNNDYTDFKIANAEIMEIKN